MRIKVLGIQETTKNLTNIGKQVSKLDVPMRQAAAIISRDARINAPVDTGRLRASLLPSVRSGGGTTEGVVGSNLIYAAPQELGTKPFWPPVSALETWARRHGMVAFLVARAISRRGIRAKRYLQRAWNKNKNRISAIFDAYIKRVTQ
jgi:hypothetical protein